ncbi:MAG: serine/threonine protein kinase [Planctomycetia bacterium]|nr:serine/threonine protein kinase [Planctomycetia bacterium]
MPSSTTQHLLHTLQAHKLLTSPQLAEATRSLTALEPVALVQHLVKRGWLTAYQARHLNAGLGQELLLDPYVLLEPLGEGGMGVVFKARHSVMNRLVALKIVRKELLSRPNAVRRFVREIEAASQLSHPNIVIAHDAAEKDGRHFFVMEYLEGIDLTKLVRRRGPLPAREACEYVRQASLGLQHAHEKGLVHRDVKPSNLMVTRGPGGQGVLVKVLDLGLALLHSDEADGLVTQEGAVMGSPDYIAPEQAVDAHRADIRSDVYSLGCTFYHLLAGLPPFAGGTMATKIAGHLHGEPPALEKKRPDLPRYLVLVVRKMMMKNPEERFQTLLEVAQTLDHVIDTMLPGAELPPLPFDELSAADESASALTATEGPTAPVPAAPTPAAPPLAAIIAPPPRPALRKPAAAAPASPPSLSSAATVRSTGPDPVPAAPAPVAVAVSPAAPAPAAPIAAIPLPPAPVAALLPDGTDVAAVSVLPSMTPSLAPLDAAPTMAPMATLLPEARPLPAASPRWRDPRWLVPSGFVFLLLFLLWLLRGSTPPPTRRDFPVEITEKARYSWYPRELVAVLGEDRGRHWGAVRSLASSADGRLLVSGSDDGIIRLWEPPLLRELDRILPEKGGHTGSVLALAVSPNGRYLLSSSRDGTVRLWDLPTLKEVRRFAGHGGARQVRFSSDNEFVLTSHDYVTWKAYNLQSGSQTHDLPGTFTNSAVYRTPDDRWLLAGKAPPARPEPQDALLELHEAGDARNLKLTQTFKGHTATFLAVAYAPATRRVLSSNNDGTVRLWDAATGSEVRRLTGHDKRVVVAAFSPDGRRALTGSEDGLIKTWDALTGQPLATFDGHRATLTCWAFLPGSDYVVTGNEDCTLRLWRVDTGKEPHPLRGHTRLAQSVAFSPDGRRVLSGGADNFVYLWELRGGRDIQQDLHRFPTQNGGVPFVAFLKDERRLLTVDGNGVTRQWEHESGQIKLAFEWPLPARPNVWMPSPDSSRLLGGGPPSICLVDLGNGMVAGGYTGHFDRTFCLAYGADGRRFLSGSEDLTVRLWDVEKSQEIGRCTGHTQPVRAVAFSPNGQLLSASQDNTIAYWEAVGKPPVKRLELERGLLPSISAARFSPDAALLACTSHDGHIWLWDTATGKRRNADWKMPGAVLNLAWAADSQHLATANANGTVYVYRLGTVEQKAAR